MTELITISDIKAIKGIADNVNTVKDLAPHILEAQLFDLRPFIGDEFYLSLVDDFNSSPSLADYSDLFNGVRYTYGGNSYEQYGIKTVLAYYTYARYLAQGGVKDTPSGLMLKNSTHSSHVSDKTITRLVAQATSAAKAHEDMITDYLSRNAASYPLWKCSAPRQSAAGLKFRSIG